MAGIALISKTLTAAADATQVGSDNTAVFVEDTLAVGKNGLLEQTGLVRFQPHTLYDANNNAVDVARLDYNLSTGDVPTVVVSLLSLPGSERPDTTIWFQNTTTPSAFSASNMYSPTLDTWFQLGSGDGDDWTTDSPPTLTIPLTLTDTDGNDLPLYPLFNITSSSLWNGYLNFAVRFDQAQTATNHAFEIGFSYAFSEVAFFSGVRREGDGPARAVRDGRFGFPALSHELVEDGENRGVWVRPEDQDPEEEEQTYRPRRGEGSRRDRVNG